MAKVKCGDVSIDPNGLPSGLKLALLPLFTKYLGFFRAMALLYGGTSGSPKKEPDKRGMFGR